MKQDKTFLIQKSKKNYRAARSKQTGFSSPATHYTEPRIDLNEVLVKNTSATFYVRVSDNSFAEFDIFKDDVLIIDKSIVPKESQLALVVKEGAFQIEKIALSSKTPLQLWGVITYIIKSTL